jgi:hypothetical protein
METVAMLAGQPQDMLVDPRNIDRNRVIMRFGGEKRGHQREVVILALEGKLIAPLGPAFENRPECQNVIAQFRYRRFPSHSIAALDVPLDLSAQAQNEATFR